MSWTRNSVEIPPISKLQDLFDALFLETPESKKRRLASSFKLNSSILDVVREDAAALKKRISQSDTEKLDEYFTSIRQVEHRLAQSTAWLFEPKPKTKVIAKSVLKLRLMPKLRLKPWLKLRLKPEPRKAAKARAA